MILSDLVLETRVNQNWGISGIDSFDKCLNKQHFLNYPHPVEYQFNSRGFRDSEWPDSIEELQDAIWCVGDSFTVGIGSPYAFTWPQILSKATSRRCINVSMDGASNAWISRRARQIIQEINPTHMVILWSYFQRRELPDTRLSDELRRTMISEEFTFDSEYTDLLDFISCYYNVNSCSSSVRIFNGTVPGCTSAWIISEINNNLNYVKQSWDNIKDPSWGSAPIDKIDFDLLPEHVKADVYAHAPDIPQYLESYGTWYKFVQSNQLLRLTNLDHARDYHHFDKITSEFFVQEIYKKFNHTHS